MLFSQRIPLAWLNLTHDRRRFLVSLAGVSFAVILMFVEMGFLNALLDSTAALIEHLNADLVVISKSRYALSVVQPFPRARLYQTLRCTGVKAVHPVYIEGFAGLWHNVADGSDRPIRVLAFDPVQPILRIPEVLEHGEALKLPDTVLVDVKSKKLFGPLVADMVTELSDHTVKVVGTFALGTDFTNDGNVIMSADNFARFFPRGLTVQASLDEVDVGLIQLNDSADQSQILRDLRTSLPDDVLILTRDEYADMEREFWQKSTPIGFVFGLGTAMGFVVGVIICYQILSTDVADHLPEYATLKAIGYDDRYLTGVVMQEALLLSLFGFVPGVAVTWLLYALLAALTGLPMQLTLFRGSLVLILTVFMCAISGMIAIRKVQAADPAEVF